MAFETPEGQRLNQAILAAMQASRPGGQQYAGSSPQLMGDSEQMLGDVVRERLREALLERVSEQVREQLHTAIRQRVREVVRQVVLAEARVAHVRLEPHD